MGWWKKTMETIGKAIPNEISKTASVTKWIPVIGPYLQAIGGIDAAATAYGDTGDWGKMAGAALNAGMGYGQDPGQYGGDGSVNRDIWNTIGQVGNIGRQLTGTIAGAGAGNDYHKIFGAAKGVNTGVGIFSNPYLFGGGEEQDTFEVPEYVPPQTGGAAEAGMYDFLDQYTGGFNYQTSPTVY